MREGDTRHTYDIPTEENVFVTTIAYIMCVVHIMTHIMYPLVYSTDPQSLQE